MNKNTNKDDSEKKIRMALVFKTLSKYLIEGIAIAVAAFLIPNRKSSISEVVLIGVTAALCFFILDVFAPAVGGHTRQGAGLGIGYGLVAHPPIGYPMKGVGF